MYDFFKNIAEANSWGFSYGRPDYHNLVEDVEADKVYLFAHPVEIGSTFSEVGNESLTYSGMFMLLLSSDVDEEYENKYNDYIKPLIMDSLQQIKDELVCSDFQINSIKLLEVIGLYDQNFDGVHINYNISLID